jgi:antitoxin (DNA-binding transcriptional repressor) of toxin-antitoxin stability system
MSDRTAIVGFYEARTRLSALLDGVEQGRAVVITRHGKPIAMLAALPEKVTDETLSTLSLPIEKVERQRLANSGYEI